MGFGGHGIRFMTVEEEIEMLEGAKVGLETQIKNIEDRLKKLKAWLPRSYVVPHFFKNSPFFGYLLESV